MGKNLTETTQKELWRNQQEIINGKIPDSENEAFGDLIDDSVAHFLELILKGKTEHEEFQTICAYTLKKLGLGNIINGV